MDVRNAKAAETKARIRQAAIDVHTERLWEGFTLEEVARRAGTTVQTVLRIYGSKAALERLLLEASSERERKPSPPGDVEAAVAALYDDYESIGDQVIRLLADEPRVPGMPALLDQGRAGHRRWTEATFAPQLRARRGAARERALVRVLLVTDVYTWKLLRRDFHLKRAAAERIVVEMIHAVIGE
jgi:AcrR family transcriptional regulator